MGNPETPINQVGKSKGKPENQNRELFHQKFHGHLIQPMGYGVKLPKAVVLLRCPTFEDVRREVRKDQTTGTINRPRSIGARLRNPRWAKR
jgi:hypothetical protein